MTFQTLAAFLISWVVPTSSSPDSVESSGIPRWEKHPMEQRLEREQTRDSMALWSKIPRSY